MAVRTDFFSFSSLLGNTGKVDLMLCLWRGWLAVFVTVSMSVVAIGAPILDDTGKDGPRFLGGFVIGNEFTVDGSDIQVNSLGVWDQADDGLAESHEVGLWDSLGALVVSATVPSGTAGALEDSYRYVNLGSSVTLLAGQSYRIAALYPSAVDPFNDPWDPDGDGNPFGSPAVGDGVAVTFGGGVAAVNSDYFAASATLTHPTNFGGGTPGRWGAANARLAVPEPTSTVIAVFGVVLLNLPRRSPWSSFPSHYM